MQIYLFAAAMIAVVVACVHSVLGEILIFRHLRKRGLIPTVGAPLFRERYIRIIWATWHMTSIFGCGLAAILMRLAFFPDQSQIQSFALNTIAISMSASALLVFFSTKGKHPGWCGLLAVAVLTWLG